MKQSNKWQEIPERSYDPQTGITVHQYSNGNTLTEYPDGSRIFFDSTSGKRTGYNARTSETTTYDLKGQVIDSSDISRASVRAANTVFSQTSSHSQVISTYDPTTGNTFVQNYDGLNHTGIFNSSGKLISTVNGDIPTAMKASGLGLPDQPVYESRTYKDGNLEDGQVRHGFVAREGWESTHKGSHTGRDEIVSGVNLDSKSTFDAQSFIGGAAKGEAGVKWTREQAHLHAQGRAMHGAEANVDAGWKGALDVEGTHYKPRAEVQGNANAFAGAELEGRGDVNISSDGGRGSLGGEAFAGEEARLFSTGDQRQLWLHLEHDRVNTPRSPGARSF